MLRIILLGGDLTASGVEKHLQHFEEWDIELKVFPQPRLPLVESVWDPSATHLFEGLKYHTFTRIAALYGVGVHQLSEDLYQIFNEEKLRLTSSHSSEFFSINIKEKILFYGEETHSYDHLISTLPLYLFLHCLDESFSLSLAWRDRLHRVEDLPPQEMELYVETKGKFFIIREEEILWRTPQETTEENWTRDLFFYPESSHEVEEVLLQLEERSIYSRGKYGAWKTTSPDMEFLQGVEVVDTILGGAAETALFQDQVEERFLLEDPTSILVVYRNNESLSWISEEECGSRTIVYNRGSSFSTPVFNTIDAQKLKGSHVGAFLDYIITNYHDLPNVSVFVSGKFDLFRDKQGIPPLEDYEETLSFFAGPSTTSSNWGLLPRSNVLVEEIEAGFVSPYKGTLKELWHSIFSLQEEPPETFVHLIHPIFSVHSSTIQRRPLSFYQHMRSLISHHKNPEECRYIDALWPLIFSS